MMSWNSILVCLDLSAGDDPIVDYAANLATQLESIQEVVLLHNIRFDFDVVSSTFSKADIALLRRKIKKRLTEAHKPKFTHATKAFDVVVSDKSSTTKAIFTEAKQRSSNAILMGKKASNEGMGIVPQKILAADQRRIPLLLIPSNAIFSLKQVVAAVDLSNATRKVMQTAKMFERELLSTITLLHVYKLPINYFPHLETSIEELSETLEKKAIKQMQQLQAELDEPNKNSWQMVTRKSANISGTLITYVEQFQADLLVIGRLGKTNLFGNNIGGVTRTLLNKDMKVSVCIV